MFLEIVDFFIFVGAAKLRWAGGAQRPVGRGNEPKKTGTRSARARTRGRNPLVIKKPLIVFLNSAYCESLKVWPDINIKIKEFTVDVKQQVK